jgi:hypothetical protein
MAKLIVQGMGLAGVNVDRNPLELADNELTQSQNASTNGNSSLRKRPGLLNFSTTVTAGTVLGGVSLPFQDQLHGTHYLYVGRGPTV